jgi:FtsH-binding integral membrane protein
MDEQNILVGNATDLEKATFYKKTYLHVAFAILAFMAVESVLLKTVSQEIIFSMISSRLTWLFILGLFWLGSVISTKMSFSPSREQQYLGLAFYVILEAVIFLPLIAISVAYAGGEVILQAAITTLFMFSGLTAVVFFTNTDFSFLRTTIIIGGSVALGTIVAGAIFGFNLGLWFSAAMVVLASACILYQTHAIKEKYGTQQYVGAALQLFSSIMILFYYVLSILSRRR